MFDREDDILKWHDPFSICWCSDDVRNHKIQNKLSFKKTDEKEFKYRLKSIGTGFDNW